MRYPLLLLLLVTFSVPAEAVYYGKVVKIADGDTLTLLVDSEQLKIRLSDIDTPSENNHSAPGQSRRFLTLPLASKRV